MDQAKSKATRGAVMKRAEFDPRTIFPEFDGACPCDHNDDYNGLKIETHCWRTNWNCDCKYSGVHITVLPHCILSAKAIRGIGMDLKKWISKSYSTSVSLTIRKL